MLRQKWQSNTCMMEDEEEDSMGMTMTQKILARHVGRETVEAGDLLVSQVNLVLANDITGPPAIKEFNKIDVRFLTGIKLPWFRIIFRLAKI